MTKKEILQQALTFRNQEILSYQINIENYKRAIEKSKNDPDLSDFTKQLETLLKAEIIECKKSKIMEEVISEQLEELNVYKD